MTLILDEISTAVVQCDDEKVANLVNKALTEGLEAEVILNEGLSKGMNIVGDKFKEGEFFVPEVLVASQAMQRGISILKPLLTNEDDNSKKATVLIGTVQGDLHDIGKRLVGMMLEGAGFKVVDLGTDVSADQFVKKVKEIKPELLGMSAMLTTTMPIMKDTIEALKSENLYTDLQVMIGGAPITEKYATEIGAHYSFDAPSAVELANELVAIKVM